MTAYRRLLVFIGFTVLASTLLADEAIVRRNTHLRDAPSTTAKSLRVLLPEEEVDVLDSAQKDGFLHVQTEDGLQGWAYARYIREQAPAGQLLPKAAEKEVAAATAIAEDWQKPAPVAGNFKLNGNTCGPTGSGDKRDRGTNLRKNRTDLPSSYHDVTWRAIAELPYPQKAPKSREQFTPELLAGITKVEGAAVQTVGYIVAIKPQKSNSESCNCAWHGEDATDWHIALVEHPGDGEKTSIVVEPTPRIKIKHPKWTKKNLEPWLNEDLPVRISGWLLLDPQHTNHLNKYRNTLWEIHPVTKIEVWNDATDKWEDIDNLPTKTAGK
jgi:hypothetical protein